MDASPPSSATTSPGAVLAGKYRIDRALGRGGMAVVFAATHIQLREPVAIKVLHRQVLTHPGAFERFLREARVAMRLRSEHVARVHDIGTAEDGTPFIVMELLRGSDFATLLVEQGPFSVSDAVDYVLQACQALVEAHAAGVVHRDLKPANLFLCPSIDGSPCVKVLDFGVSKLLVDDSPAPDPFALTAPPSTRSPASSEANRRAAAVSSLAETADSAPGGVTLTRAFLGSPQYMAPEQIRSARDVDVRADIWALGVILHELVTGGRPFRGDTLSELCDCILERHPAPLRIPGGASPELETALASCLAKDPADRYQNVRAFAEAVVRFGSTDGKGSFDRIVRMTEPASSAPRAAKPPVGGAEPTLDSDQRRSPAMTSPVLAPGNGERGRSRRRVVRAAAAVAAMFAIGGGALVRTRATERAEKARAEAALVAARCTSSSACAKANGGAPARCREDGKCVQLGSEDCVVLADRAALESEDTVWFGALLPKDSRSPDDSDLHAVDLAREDFTQMMSGFAHGGRDARVHPFGVVGCDDSKNAMRAARHLVEDVRVPAIIGFASGGEVVDVGSALLIPNGVLGAVSLSPSPLVTSLPNTPGQPRLIWRTTYSSAEAARAMGRVIPDLLEPQVRAMGGALGPIAPLRVALLRTKRRGGPAFDTLLFSTLRFNGKSALENESNYREIILDDSDPSKLDVNAKAVVESLDLFAPHVIVNLGNGEALTLAIERLERTWSHSAYRPRYLSMNAWTKPLVDWMGKSADRRRRFFGLEPVSGTEVNARFVMHYNESSATKITRNLAPNTSYDAFYLLAYASYALGETPVTGVGLARAIGRLVPPGRPIDVGPAGIFDAYSTLRRGENVDLNGATGSLDFDLATGEAPFDEAVLCVGKDDLGFAADSVESGVVFRSQANRLEGTLRCP